MIEDPRDSGLEQVSARPNQVLARNITKSLRQPNTAETILEEAQRLVHGDRGASYGHPIDDYACTGRIWGAVLEKWLHTLHGFPKNFHIPDIDPRICALMMVGVKVSREANKHKRDNNTDIAGYAECTQMIADAQYDSAGLDVETSTKR